MEFTQQEIDELKKTHKGRLFLCSAPDLKKSCILKVPGRKELSMATATMQKSPMKFTESIMKSCYVAGDNPADIAEENDEFFLAVSAKLDELIKVSELELKEL